MDEPTIKKKPPQVLSVNFMTPGAYRAIRRFAKSQGKKTATWAREVLIAASKEKPEASK